MKQLDVEVSPPANKTHVQYTLRKDHQASISCGVKNCCMLAVNPFFLNSLLYFHVISSVWLQKVPLLPPKFNVTHASWVILIQ